MKTKVFKIINIVLLVVAVIMLIIGLIIVNSDVNRAAEEAEKQTYSSEHIAISPISKTESMSGSNYVTEITFCIKNNSIHNISLISGNMEFYYGDIKLGSGNISFDKDITALTSATITIEFKGYNDVYRKIYETPYENLGLTYQITSILFDNADNTSTHWQYNNSEVKWIKTAAANTPSEMPVKVEDVYLDQSSVTLEIGENTSLVAYIYPENATDSSIEWNSSDPLVATVDNNGNVSALAEGEAIIYATNEASGKFATCTINVWRDYPDFYFTTTSFTTSNYDFCSGMKISRYRGSESAITIPTKYKADNVVAIGEALFQDYISLTSITIPNSVRRIDTNAFSGCINLRSVYYTGSIEEWAEIDFVNYLANPLYNGADLYINGSKVTDVKISGYVSQSAFAGSKIESLTVTGSSSISGGAFYECNSLKIVNIHEGLSSIEDVAFADCANLTTIFLPSSLNYIGEQAFRNCTSLTRINYAAQKSWWNAISKGYRWNNNTGEYTIYCTDGNILKI